MGVAEEPLESLTKIPEFPIDASALPDPGNVEAQVTPALAALPMAEEAQGDPWVTGRDPWSDGVADVIVQFDPIDDPMEFDSSFSLAVPPTSTVDEVQTLIRDRLDAHDCDFSLNVVLQCEGTITVAPLPDGSSRVSSFFDTDSMALPVGIVGSDADSRGAAFCFLRAT